jgi:arylsulfatase A-like enzyme
MFGPTDALAEEARRQGGWYQAVNRGERAPSGAELEALVRLYDGNLAYADQEIGALRRSLEAAGLWERCVVVVAADHGEGLYEHGWVGHNVQLYEESVRVPLVVKLPRAAGVAGRRVSGLADLLDVAPTIADVFGAREKAGTFEGRSLLPMIAGAPGKPAQLSRTVWDRPRYALRDAGHKYLYDTRTGAEELYDLAADPSERRNLAPAEPVRSAFYRQTLHHWIAGLGRRGEGGGEQATLSREQCENLKALGYLDAKTPCPKE